ncbi:MAG: nuclear transport factor 2 family protein [Saccharothrix sp.]|nr:nuclear transport factor 2 family protein [Saccharothrix sp.]
MAWFADRRDWDALLTVFADEVDLDYTSLTGGEPGRVKAVDLVAGWRAGLGGLDATQHLVSNHLVEVDGDRAVATAQFQAVHVLANPHGEPTWTLGGHYRFGLVRADGGWLIDAVTMTTTWASGNQHVMTLAAQRAG